MKRHNIYKFNLLNHLNKKLWIQFSVSRRDVLYNLSSYNKFLHIFNIKNICVLKTWNKNSTYKMVLLKCGSYSDLQIMATTIGILDIVMSILLFFTENRYFYFKDIYEYCFAVYTFLTALILLMGIYLVYNIILNT